ncbi:hypothetical protein SAMN05421805_1183 [Saccharopolyspora antimicrobica]|uniref:Uncharacterized protein n=1 Tax=Saccharopolyspora antimicrobica TaxID=455193 RepID=A0A1I5IAR6_9PSEU|nr:hypothetical protein [Saccharopolyspora antimicrobica]RKT85596.1 hypothetical protein ATL45_3943 [Saccharopolyspora antimicrobica]SFO57081.1 hypothetical protein SAMN05421805_1183 [Saccharopolyspora antimicrobica]
MLPHTPEAARAIEAPERTFATRFRVDWDRDGRFAHPLSDLSRFVKPWRREHIVSSTAPDELLLIEGHAAARLTVPLAGDVHDEPIAVQFAPYNRDSLLFGVDVEGADVELDVAVWTDEHGFEWFPQFRGVVRSPATDRGDGTVVLECLDNAEKLRGLVQLPPYALWERHLQRGFKRGQLIDSSSLIDLAARAGGFTMGPRGFSWPDELSAAPYRTGVVLSVPMHGSILPEVGTLDNEQGIHRTEAWETGDAAHRARAEAYREGPHGYLARQAVPRGEEAAGFHTYWIDELDRGVAGAADSTWVLGGWFYWAGPNVDAATAAIELQVRGHRFTLALEPSNGAGLARMQYATAFDNDQLGGDTYERIDGPFSPLPSEPGWHYYEAAFAWWSNGDIEMRSCIDDRRQAPRVVANRATTAHIDRLSGLVTIRNTWAVSDVAIVNGAAKPPLAQITYDTTPAGTAQVSWGRNRATHTLRESFEAFTLAKDVASAEYGLVLFDESGRFCFYNSDDVVDRQATTVRTFTLDDLGNLGFRTTLDSVRNVWSVTTTSARTVVGIAYDLGEDGVPLARAASGELLPAEFIIPARSARELFIQADDHTIAVNPWGLPLIAEAAPWDQQIPRHGRQVYTGTDYREGTSASTEQKFVSRGLVRLWVWNGWAEPVGFVNPNGQPRFRVEGSVVVEDAEKTWTIRNEASIATRGERVIELSGKWLQDEWQTRAMLDRLVPRIGDPIPVSDAITVPGDPRVQNLDCIAIADQGGFGHLRTQIYGLTRSVDDDGRLTDTYQVEAIAPPAPGVWDSSSWDSTFIWS